MGRRPAWGLSVAQLRRRLNVVQAAHSWPPFGLFGGGKTTGGQERTLGGDKLGRQAFLAPQGVPLRART